MELNGLDQVLIIYILFAVLASLIDNLNDPINLTSLL